MTKQPLVTIITITHNIIDAGRREKFIQCIESIHSQTYKNIEHIVVDGSSTDGTLDLIKEYKQKGYISSYISEKDEGVYEAFNKGIMLANGKYIAFLNSDDFYHDISGVAETVSALEETNADFSYAPCVIINEAVGKTEVYRPNIYCAFTKTPFMHATMFTKKDVLIRENLFDKKYKTAADYHFILKLLLKKSKFVFVDKTFVSFRAGGISCDSKLVKKEVSKLYFDIYSQLCCISKEVCEKLWSKDVIPLNLMFALMNRCEFRFALGMICSYFNGFFPYYLPIFRKWLVQIRTKKGQETFRFLGIYFIKPKAEEN